MKHVSKYGAQRDTAQSLLRYGSIVVPDDKCALSVVSSANTQGFCVRRRRIYRGHGVRLSLKGESPVGRVRAKVYGANKATIIELETVGSMLVTCANAAECLRVAARRLGWRVKVARVGGGPNRTVTLVREDKAAA